MFVAEINVNEANVIMISSLFFNKRIIQFIRRRYSIYSVTSFALKKKVYGSKMIIARRSYICNTEW